jgi:hypothetical protein
MILHRTTAVGVGAGLNEEHELRLIKNKWYGIYCREVFERAAHRETSEIQTRDPRCA